MTAMPFRCVEWERISGTLAVPSWVADGAADMPRFFFHTDDERRAFHDRLGVDLPSVDDAAREALGLLRDLSYVDKPPASRTIAATVLDETGTVVVQVTMSIASRQRASPDVLGAASIVA